MLLHLPPRLHQLNLKAAATIVFDLLFLLFLFTQPLSFSVSGRAPLSKNISLEQLRLFFFLYTKSDWVQKRKGVNLLFSFFSCLSFCTSRTTGRYLSQISLEKKLSFFEVKPISFITVSSARYKRITHSGWMWWRLTTRGVFFFVAEIGCCPNKVNNCGHRPRHGGSPTIEPTASQASGCSSDLR